MDDGDDDDGVEQVIYRKTAVGYETFAIDLMLLTSIYVHFRIPLLVNPVGIEN